MNAPARWALLGALTLTLAGCSAARWEKPAPVAVAKDPMQRDMTRTKRGNPPFYEVFGVRYEVMRDSTGYKERGIASWYGKKFHGRQTSNGEPYDMYRMTAAHKNLPLPTNVKVTNLSNGHSVIVRVNDRGPFVKNRLIDLSYAAALELDMITNGTAMVEVEVLDTSYTGPITTMAAADPPAKSEAGTAKPAMEQAPAAPALYLQVGAFGESGNAHNLAAQLTDSGVDGVAVHKPAGEQPELYRVRIGPFRNVSEYDRVVAQVEILQIKETQLVVENGPAIATQVPVNQ